MRSIKPIFTVHGEWGDWSSWATCSVTCGGGRKSRSRNCDSPAPAHGGNNCTGHETEGIDCNGEACPGR